jgi:hypothetical protein
MAQQGHGFPDLIRLLILGNLAASQTNLDAVIAPIGADATEGGNVYHISDVQIHAQTVGIGGTGTDTYILQLCDINGTLISTLATIAVPANTKLFRLDLRTGGKGLRIPASRGLRLDTGTIGSGYSTTPANIKVSVAVQDFGNGS